MNTLTNVKLAEHILNIEKQKSTTTITDLSTNGVCAQIAGLSIIHLSPFKTLTELSAFFRRSPLDAFVLHSGVLNDGNEYYGRCIKVSPNTWNCFIDIFKPIEEDIASH